jgi:hypothetical protein
VAVGVALGDAGRADRPSRADPVLDDHRLAERRRQLLGEDARHGVRGAARAHARNEPDRLAWKTLRERGARPDRQRGGAQAEAFHQFEHDFPSSKKTFQTFGSPNCPASQSAVQLL